jgi:hypothetical protein
MMYTFLLMLIEKFILEFCRMGSAEVGESEMSFINDWSRM